MFEPLIAILIPLSLGIVRALKGLLNAWKKDPKFSASPKKFFGSIGLALILGVLTEFAIPGGSDMLSQMFVFATTACASWFGTDIVGDIIEKKLSTSK